MTSDSESLNDCDLITGVTLQRPLLNFDDAHISIAIKLLKLRQTEAERTSGRSSVCGAKTQYTFETRF